MHILITILQILGNVLLVLLLVFLILLFLLLFVPVRYEAKGSYQEKKIVLCGKVRYLFPFVQLLFSYDQTKKMQLRILGILVKDFLSEQQQTGKKTGKRKKKNAGEKTGEKIPDNKTQSTKETPAKETPDERDADAIQPEDDTGRGEIRSGAQDADQIVQTDQTGEKRTFVHRIGTFMERVRSFPDSLCRRVKAFCKKWKEILGNAKERKEQILSYIAFWQREDVQKAIGIAGKTLRKVLRSILPRKKRLYLHVGLGDPASTGQLCGFYGMIYPFVGNYVIIEPDFSQLIYEGDFYVKGKITLFVLLKAACIFLFHKDLKCIRKLVMHKEVANE